MLAVGLVSIVTWQNWLLEPHPVRDGYVLHAGRGMFDDAKFVYFYYHLGLLPVMSTQAAHVESRAGAERHVRDHPGSLRMDSSWTWLEGGWARIFLYLPDVWVKGDSRAPSVKLANTIAFQLALCAMFLGFWWIGLPQLGALSVLFAGSNPFQIHAVHVLESVHSWVITTALLMLAIHLPLLAPDRRPRTAYLWIAPVLAGLLLGTVRGIRSEAAIMLAAGVFTYVSLVGHSWRFRSLLVALMIGSFVATDFGWNRYFEHEYREAQRVLAQVGGNPLPRPFQRHHRIWHPIFCGLGDFDQKYGYRWLDEAGLDYAKPRMESRYNIYVPPTLDGNNGYRVVNSTLPAAAFWDRQRIYRRLPYEMKEYEAVIRDKVLGDIMRDPGWYATILAKRVTKLNLRMTPVRAALGSVRWEVPATGFLIIPLVVMLMAAGSWALLKVVVFTLPTCVTAVLIYSAWGTTYYAIYHLFMMAVIVALLLAAAGRAVGAAREWIRPTAFRRSPRAAGPA
ncbi:MAG TPA: hypothetical protein VEY91_01535 [Candidatus Limnocylindria bacterium]|nr:hypothetical protein [Candidatus Limnocylindria bacterium]